MHLRYVVFLLFVLPLAGCSLATDSVESPATGVALQGRVMGGQQPVSQAHIYLLAASNAGYGSASTSLITSGSAGSDSIGEYVLTNSVGVFTITGDYTCTAGQQVYVYALGGDPGNGANLAATMMAAVGSCPVAGNFLATVPFIYMDEYVTVAFAYSVAGFAVDPLHIAASGTALAQVGLANAFANAGNLLNGATTPAGNGTVPMQELGTLANILAACVNSNGVVSGPSSPTACYTLFNHAKNGASVPADTATAIFNIAHNPTANVTTLFGLQDSESPFATKLATAPNDFTVAISFTGGGLGTSSAETAQTAILMNNIAIDGSGNVWRPNYGGNSITELSPLGAALSGTGGFTGGGLNEPANVAIDLSGNVWTADFGSGKVSEFTFAGAPKSGSPFSGAGVSSPVDLAIDGSGNVWVANATNVSKLTSAGANVTGSPFTSNTLDGPIALAVLPSGAVWLTNASNNTVSVYTSAGAKSSGSPYSGGGLNFPYGLAFDASGAGWMADDTALTQLTSSGGVGGSPYPSPTNAILTSLAVDGTGNIWVTDVGKNTIIETNNSATYLSGAIGLQYGQTTAPEAIAVDGSGNVWYSSYNDATIHELVGAGSPVVTPLAYGVKNSLLGTRP